VRLASLIGSAAGGCVNLSTSLSNVAKLAAHPKFVWGFNANCDETIIYNDPVVVIVAIVEKILCVLRAQMYIVDFEKMPRAAIISQSTMYHFALLIQK
jgi:hypothetical protein